MVTQPHLWREVERNPHRRTRYARGGDGSGKQGARSFWSRLVGRPLSALPVYLPVKAQVVGSSLMNPVMRDPDSSPGCRGRKPGEFTPRVSWLGPPASRCCIALHGGNSPPDRSNSTRFGWRKAGCSRRSHNPDKSPTTDYHNTSTPVRDRPTTSRSVRCASHGTSARRQSRCATPRSYRGTRRRGNRPHGTRRREIHRRGNPRRETRQTPAMKSATTVKSASAVETAAAPMRCVGEIWLAENSGAQQRSRNAHQRPPFPAPGSAIA
jgi:hypothetical protein